MSFIQSISKYVSSVVGRAQRKPAKLYFPSYYSGILGGIVHPDDFNGLIKACKGWVYVCATQNAISVAQTPLRLYAAKTNDKETLFRHKSVSDERLDYMSKSSTLYKYIDSAVEVEEITEHPVLELLKKPNSWDNGLEFIQKSELHQELVGNTYWYIVFNNIGLPQELWILPPEKTTVVPDKIKYVSGYTYHKGIEKIPIPVDEIIHIRMPSPSNLYYGEGPLAAASDYVNIDRKMNEYELSVFDNQARPDIAIKVASMLSDEQYDRLKQDHADMFRGHKNVSKSIILEDGTDVVPINFSPKDLAFLSGRGMMKEAIANVFGVPISMLTTSDVNKANAQTGSVQYKRDTVLPRLSRLEQVINTRLLPLYDTRLFVAYDNPVPADRESDLKENTEYVKAGIKTANEVRGDLGLDPLEGGDELQSNSGNNFEEDPLEEKKRELAEEAKRLEKEIDGFVEKIYG